MLRKCWARIAPDAPLLPAPPASCTALTSIPALLEQEGYDQSQPINLPAPPPQERSLPEGVAGRPAKRPRTQVVPGSAAVAATSVLRDALPKFQDALLAKVCGSDDSPSVELSLEAEALAHEAYAAAVGLAMRYSTHCPSAVSGAAAFLGLAWKQVRRAGPYEEVLATVAWQACGASVSDAKEAEQTVLRHFADEDVCTADTIGWSTSPESVIC